MRLYELLIENVSKETSVRNIIDILTVRMPDLYHQLGIMADNYHHNNGKLGKGYSFLSGGLKSKWYKNVYEMELKPALAELIRSSPGKLGLELKAVLYKLNGKFSDIEDGLLPVLYKSAKDTKNENLVAAIRSAYNARGRYEAELNKLEAESEHDEHSEGNIKIPKEKDSSGRNQELIQRIINDTLNRPEVRKHAGDIRNIVARSGNKLLTLKQELEKRGINF
jgi:hypothetical protein